MHIALKTLDVACSSTESKSFLQSSDFHFQEDRWNQIWVNQGFKDHKLRNKELYKEEMIYHNNDVSEALCCIKVFL